MAGKVGNGGVSSYSTSSRDPVMLTGCAPLSSGVKFQVRFETVC